MQLQNIANKVQGMAHFIGSGKQVLYEPVLRALSCGVFFLVWFFLGVVFYVNKLLAPTGAVMMYYYY